MEDKGASEEKSNNLVANIREQLPVGTLKGRLQRWVFRLIAGGVGYPYFEQVRENLDAVEGRSRVNQILAEEVGRQAIADPAIMERAKARFLGGLLEKQENLEDVLRRATNKVDADDSMNETSPDASGTNAEPSADWFAAFAKAAEDAHSDELREQLATLLAGEVRKPGSYRKSTIRLIAEIDAETLISFRDVLAARGIGDAIYTKSEWSSGPYFKIATVLETNGLITGSGGFTQRQLSFVPEGNGFIIGRQIGAVFSGELTTPVKQLPIWLLTDVGKEFSSLLDVEESRFALREICQGVDKNAVKEVYIGRVHRVSETQYFVTHDEVVWRPEP